MTRMHVTYRIDATPMQIEARARALAIEQSVECPMGAVRDARVRDAVVGRVMDIVPAGENVFEARIGLALETVGDDAGQLLNMLFGNSSLQPDVRLEAVDWPDGLPALPGPRFGIDGVRERLGIPRGPIACSALKPQGMDVEALAALAYLQARAGIALIKDDHGLADPVSAPFARRVPAIQAAVARANAETGRRSVYAPNLNGGARKLQAQVQVCRDHGVGAVMMCPLLVGPSTMAEWVADGLDMPVLAHPALAGVGRIAPALLYGTLFRLFGADMVIFPNFGGRFADDARRCHAIAEAARAPLGALPPALPVPAGGLSPDRVPELVDFYGPDVALLIGGSLLAAEDPEAAMRHFVDAVEQQGRT
ncbi:ribulose 1,5-bisphosphate carboxylase [Nitrogeniibacter mangrovi]|uniref:Ribulose 1,5-bisphosphate carboxylase n=1 Tax=Nitrogeniibacter mangrovi TaxID=2016596 RepID=A0A6C1B9F0_9RHOO|nr:RuBisCO large subunit C-terminal-like domain-containing protein [Nitrogeniibacter mangrovi]QID18874.1 ribulose 1,5-bisphosphate carboxylase [Nitrogeniibacter mangrovi]